MMLKQFFMNQRTKGSIITHICCKYLQFSRKSPLYIVDEMLNLWGSYLFTLNYHTTEPEKSAVSFWTVTGICFVLICVCVCVFSCLDAIYALIFHCCASEMPEWSRKTAIVGPASYSTRFFYVCVCAYMWERVTLSALNAFCWVTFPSLIQKYVLDNARGHGQTSFLLSAVLYSLVLLTFPHLLSRTLYISDQKICPQLHYFLMKSHWLNSNICVYV